MLNDIVVIAGNSNLGLATEICETLWQPLGLAQVRRFSDGEILVELGENVRGRDTFVIQSTCAPVNDNLMELLLIIDALKRASARRITAVIPYYGYARQDRKAAPRVPISAKLVADLLTAAGTTRVLAMDLHAGQIQGFFDIPVDHLYAAPVLLNYLLGSYLKDGGEDVILVSPDAGGVERTRYLAKKLSTPLAIVDKRREAANVAKAMNVIGEVKGRRALIIDDMVDTAGTLTQAADVIMELGAVEVAALATHPVFSGQALERINSSALSQVVVTNTIPLNPAGRDVSKIKVLSVASLLGEAIRRIHQEDSISSLFV
ncbi:MAG: ribose-phosphate pyrophosphokinase [Deltaproteobacteria bacterium]|jgi:ribose-phosphate pyrophosphokinase|nr:ribose-phosphate pyrophosphokinase [Deltaproteobacteria bacterium]